MNEDEDGLVHSSDGLIVDLNNFIEKNAEFFGMHFNVRSLNKKSRQCIIVFNSI